ncbi:MAG: UDP-4-amino-4,6-dideoxy-N-acetyl-beta-L-altrosamine transaminase [Planctomycetes bacterium]|nr:UDP-4-amino-4,6-dideoxy-N-acetyl-beta-L-altrosamine transaminase [Planctomycetota bacterium]
MRAKGFIQYGRQWIDDEDIRAVVEVLRSEVITQGPKVEEFEKAIADYCETKYAVAVNSGTSALHIACLASGIKEGDEAITTPITFVASANCAAYCGAKPVFADINKQTYNISPNEMGKKITPQTRIVIPVHFAGQSCDMEIIHDIVRKAEEEYGQKIFILEDACHALGSLYKGEKVGACSVSDMAVMSFHPVKHITMAEGGVVLTNDETLYRMAKRFCSHGITSDPEEFINRDIAFRATRTNSDLITNPWYYEQTVLGYNYRITDIQCALGLSQLRKLDMFRNRRREIVDEYNRAFGGVDHIQIPIESPDCNSNFHLYVLLIDFEKLGIDRAQFMIELKARGIQTQVHYIPVHLQAFYQREFGTKWGDCPRAEQYYQKCLSIPLYPAMGDADVHKVINEITRLVAGCS